MLKHPELADLRDLRQHMTHVCPFARPTELSAYTTATYTTWPVEFSDFWGIKAHCIRVIHHGERLRHVPVDIGRKLAVADPRRAKRVTLHLAIQRGSRQADAVCQASALCTCYVGLASDSLHTDLFQVELNGQVIRRQSGEGAAQAVPLRRVLTKAQTSSAPARMLYCWGRCR